MQITPRQAEVLGLLSEGLVPKEIAERMGISIETVRVHLRQARERTQSRTTEQLIARFARENYD